MFLGKRVILLIQIAISVAAVAYIIFRLFNYDEWETFYELFTKQPFRFALVFLLQLILSSLNLSIESLKWQILVSPLRRQSFNLSFYQILKGLQVGMVTPGRSGEGVAKALLLPMGYRTRGFLLSVTGSALQNVILALGGLLGLIFIREFPEQEPGMFFQLQDWLIRYSLTFLIVTGAGLVVIVRLLRFMRRNPVVKRITFYLLVVKQLGAMKFVAIVMLTLARYFVYCFQLWVMFYFLSIGDSMSLFWLIPVYYAAITFIPSMAIADIGIRGTIALFLFGAISANSAAIVAAIFFVWFCNLAIPAVSAIYFRAPVATHPQ